MQGARKRKNMVFLSVRVPAQLKKLLNKHLQHSLHSSISEFTRDAIREKLERDSPELYSQFFLEALAI